MKTEWNHSTLALREKIAVLGTEATERNLTAAGEEDASLDQVRLREACEFVCHVETITQLHLDMMKTEAPWLMTSKSMARALDFDAKVVSPNKLRPLAETLEARTGDICEKHPSETMTGQG